MEQPKKQEGDEVSFEGINLSEDVKVGADSISKKIAITDASEEPAAQESVVAVDDISDESPEQAVETAASSEPAEPLKADVPEASDEVAKADVVESTVPTTDSPVESTAPVAPAMDPKAREEYRLEPASPKKQSKKGLLVGLAVALFVAASCATAYFMFTNKDKNNEQQVVAPQQVVKLVGAELSIVDGAVQVSKDNTTWTDAKVSDQIAQGLYVRTQDGARAVIALDDGSAIRINSGSVIKLDSLDSTNVVITNVSGTVYTRLVKSDRQFSVNVANEKYVAMGTAYITVNTAENKGVEVYESKVKVAGANVEVAEGKYYYAESKNAELAKKLADLSVDKIKADAFLAWNYQQDKNIAEFKDKLGYLSKIDEPVAAKTATTTAKPAETPATAGITLSGIKYDTGVKLTWKLNGVTAPEGFKVVKGLSANPTYGKDSAVYVKSTATSYAWTLKDGKTYHFRVCIYDGKNCSSYSNNITVTAPKVDTQESSALPTGSLVLKQVSGNNVSWTLNGSAPYGYKLVWSKTANPVYPNPDNIYQYYGSESTKSGTIMPTESGTYYVRVCMYNTTGTGDKCLNYSNQLTITYTKSS